MFCYPCHFAGGTSQVGSNIKLSSVTSHVESLVIPKCYTRAKHLFTLDAFVLSLLPFPGTSHVGSNIKLSKEPPPQECLNRQMSANLILYSGPKCTTYLKGTSKYLQVAELNF